MGPVDLPILHSNTGVGIFDLFSALATWHLENLMSGAVLEGTIFLTEYILKCDRFLIGSRWVGSRAELASFFRRNIRTEKYKQQVSWSTRSQAQIVFPSILSKIHSKLYTFISIHIFKYLFFLTSAVPFPSPREWEGGGGGDTVTGTGKSTNPRLFHSKKVFANERQWQFLWR